MASNLKLSLEIISKGVDRTAAEVIRLQQAIVQAAKEGKSLDSLGNAFENATKSGSGLNQFISGVPNKVAATAFAFNQIVAALGAVSAAAQSAYSLLINQNVQLQQQLLSTQATLASTNKILVDGVQIKDPTAAIKALEGPVKEAIAQIRKGSQDLSGVTSDQLIPIFQNIATQSSQIGANLNQSAELSLNFAAALGTLSIPLEQQRQEVSSILTTQISSDSILAKSLGLTNEQVKNWKQQGVLVDELNKKLAAFRAGNALQAKTLPGVTSNIMEVFQEITRVVGEPLLGPLVEQLDKVFHYLKDNQEEIIAFAQVGSEQFLIFAESVGTSVMEIAQALLPLLQEMGPRAIETIKLVADGVKSLAAAGAVISNTIAPAIQAADEFTKKLDAGLQKMFEISKNPVFLALRIAINPQQAFREAQAAVGQTVEGLGVEGSTAAVDISANVTANLSQESIALQGRLKAAIEAKNKAQAEGRQLTDDEAKANKSLEAQKTGLIASMEQQLQVMAAQTPIGEENTRNLETQKNELKARIAALKSDSLALSDNAKKVTLVADANTAATQALQSVQSGLKAGTTSEADALKQLEAIANNAEVETQTRKEAASQIVAIRKNQNDAELAALDAQKAAIESRVKAGTLSEAAAEQELTRIREQEIQKRIDLNKQQQGTAKTESERQKLIAEEKQLQTQLQDVRTEAANTDRQQLLANFDERRSLLEGQFAQGKVSRAEYNRQLLEIDLAKNTAELSQLQEQLSKLAATDTEGREAINAKIAETYAKRSDLIAQANQRELDALEQSNDRALDESKLAETERQIEIEKQVQAGTLTHEDAEKLKAEATTQRIDDEIEAERRKFELLKNQKASNPDDEAKRQDALRTSQQKIADLTLQRIQAQKTAEKDLQDTAEEARKAAIDAIEQQRKLEDVRSRERILNLQKETQALDRQSQLQQLAAKSVDREQRLNQAAFDLTKARADAEQNRYNIQIQGLSQTIDLVRQYNAEDDPEKKAQQKKLLEALGISSQTKELDLIKQRQALEDIQAQARQKSLLAEQAIARQNAEFAARRAEIEARQQLTAAKRAEFEAKITIEKQKQAIVDAKAELSKAKQIEDPKERTTAVAEANQNIKEAQQGLVSAEDGLKAAQENRQFAEENIEVTAQMSESQRELLGVQQAATQEMFATENGLRQLNQVLELSKAGAEGFAAAIAKARDSAGTIQPAITPRRYGGSVGSNQVYEVGESGREYFIPSQNGWILNRWEADRIARDVLSASQAASLASSGAIAFSAPRMPMPATASVSLRQEFEGLKKQVQRLGDATFALANTPRQFIVNESEDGMSAALQLQQEMLNMRLRQRGR